VIKIIERVYPLPARLRAGLSLPSLSFVSVFISSASSTQMQHADAEKERKKKSDAGESAARAGIYTRGDSVIYERRCSDPLFSLSLALSSCRSVR